MIFFDIPNSFLFPKISLRTFFVCRGFVCFLFMRRKVWYRNVKEIEMGFPFLFRIFFQRLSLNWPSTNVDCQKLSSSRVFFSSWIVPVSLKLGGNNTVSSTQLANFFLTRDCLHGSFYVVVFSCFLSLSWIFLIWCDIFLGSKVTSLFFKFTVCFYWFRWDTINGSIIKSNTCWVL